MNKLHKDYRRPAITLSEIKATVWLTVGALEYYHRLFTITTEWNGLSNYIFTIKNHKTQVNIDLHFEGTLAQAEIRFNELRDKYIFDYDSNLS